jgi:hypothetical protein
VKAHLEYRQELAAQEQHEKENLAKQLEIVAEAQRKRDNVDQTE